MKGLMVQYSFYLYSRRPMFIYAWVGILLSLSTESYGQPTADLEFSRVREEGINVVDARRVVDSSGSLTEGLPVGYWQFNRAPSDEDSSIYPFEYPDHSGINLIFVHGYNTSVHDALNSIQGLASLVDRTSAELGTDVEYFVFLWRGDLGRSRFSSAQRAATISSASLLRFVERLKQETPNAKIAIIAHSLGARVALETLDRAHTLDDCDRDGNKIVDSLVLVQGAVRAVRLYTWYTDYVIDTYYFLPEEPVRRYEESTRYFGSYTDALQCTRHFLYTFSGLDSVLDRWFELDETIFPYLTPLPANLLVPPTPTERDFPYVAIGSPFDDSNRTSYFGDYFQVEAGRLTDPFDRFDPTRPQLDDFISQEFQITFRDWKIPHGNVEALNITGLVDRSRRGGRWWHSPIFDPDGANIVDEIWRRVVDNL